MTQNSINLIVGCGYLGRRVAEAWLDAGARVVALTRSTQRAAELRNAGVAPVVGDVLDPETLAKLPDAQTLLYAVGYDRTAAASKRDVYVAGLKHVLESVARRVERIVYISSVSVYGQSDGEWIDEDSPTDPVHEGGRICLDAERALWEFVDGLPAGRSPRVDVLRLAGIYGPGRLLRRVEAVRSGEPIASEPDGWLNLIHVADAVRAVRAVDAGAADQCEAGASSHTSLVSDDRPVTRREYYEMLAKLAGGPPPEFTPDGDAGRTHGLNKRCTNRRLREELGVDLKFPTIATGLPDAITTA